MNHISHPSTPTIHHAPLQNGGRIVIPADFRKALGFEVGETMVVRMENDEVRVYSLQRAVRRAQEFAKKHMKGKGSIVDELIAERRREARRERE